MDLVIVYGPPAVGKLTVARALSELCGYGVFHNHLTFDIVGAFFPSFSEPFVKMLREVRSNALKTACELGAQGIIFTICYDHPDDKPELDGFRDIVIDSGGRVFAVHLTCSTAALLGRVESEGRREFRKLTSPEKLLGTLAEWDCYTPIPGYDSLEIDNTEMAPSEAALLISNHYALGGES